MSVQYKQLGEWLGVALEMEYKGKAFYDKVEKSVVNDLGREIFSMLGNDEMVHIERIKLIYDALQSDKAWSRGWRDLAPDRPDLTTIFRDLAVARGNQITADQADVEALDIGVEFEGKSITFYANHLKAATQEMEREFLEKMMGEEKGHYRALVDMRFYLSNPAGYFFELEKMHVDGGP